MPDLRPDPAVPAQPVAFRDFRPPRRLLRAQLQRVACAGDQPGDPANTGPAHERASLANAYLGIDNHALSQPAFESALEVLAANDAHSMIAKDGEFTPTPAVSHAILSYNRGRSEGRADGIVITPSHNPPDNGGFKYNPVQWRAGRDRNHRLDPGSDAEMPCSRPVSGRCAAHAALRAGPPCLRPRGNAAFLEAYVGDLRQMVDFDAIRGAGVRMGVDPLGGAGVHYWAPLAERYKIDLKRGQRRGRSRPSVS